MSKKSKGKKNDELPVLEKYIPENRIENLSSLIVIEDHEIERLKRELEEMSSKYRKQGENYIKETTSIRSRLDAKNKENIILIEEIKKIKEERDDYEKNLRNILDKKLEIIQEKNKAEIAKMNDELVRVKEKLKITNEEKEDYKKKVDKLTQEVRNLNIANTITIQNYENQLKDITEKHHNKLKETTDIFEKFLKNNKELLTTDLYTVYRQLKNKFDSKLKECTEYKNKNEVLKEQNRVFKISMDNNDEIINECAKIQVEEKKKNKKLLEEIEEKNKIIDEMKNDYTKYIEMINDKFTEIITSNEEEIQQLRVELEIKTKKLYNLEQSSKNAINQRSELELFFIEQLNECKKEIIKKKKIEANQKKLLFPFLNQSANSSNINNSTSTKDESIYLTSVKKVDIKDIDPEYKEKILRELFNKVNEGGAKGFKKLRENL